MMQMMELLLATICFCSFIWAIFYFFTTPTGVPVAMKPLSLIGAVGVLAYFACLIFFNQNNLIGTILGSALYILSTALFWWTVQVNRNRPLSIAYSSDQPSHFMNQGPYAWIRHPFYASYLLAGIAGVVSTGVYWLIPIVVVMFFIYLNMAKFEENKFLSSDLSEQYKSYQKSTGRFVPCLCKKSVTQ